MANLTCLAIYALITAWAVIGAVFLVIMVELFRQMITESRKWTHFRHLRTHEQVRDLRRYHVGGFISEHKR